MTSSLTVNRILVVDGDGAAEFEAAAVVEGQRRPGWPTSSAPEPCLPSRPCRRPAPCSRPVVGGPAEFGIERVRRCRTATAGRPAAISDRRSRGNFSSDRSSMRPPLSAIEPCSCRLRSGRAARRPERLRGSPARPGAGAAGWPGPVACRRRRRRRGRVGGVGAAGFAASCWACCCCLRFALRHGEEILPSRSARKGRKDNGENGVFTRRSSGFRAALHAPRQGTPHCPAKSSVIRSKRHTERRPAPT